MAATENNSPTPFKVNSIAMNISREMAIMEGLVKPTTDEVAQYNADSRVRWERSVAEWVEADAFRATLSAVEDPVARAVLDLHRPVDDDTAECEHCVRGEYADHEPWPCDTVEAVARAIGIEPPAPWLGHRPGPEPSTMPAEGYKPYALHRLSGFVDEAMGRTLDATVFHGTTP